jgi:predicted glycogen debranching enzyme
MGIELPKIALQQQGISDFEKAIQTEWLVTNGIGGFASSTILGINTRKYHGLLVAALNPPVNRWVLLSKLDEEVRIKEKTYQLGSNEFRGSINPDGHHFLQGFWLTPLPVYRYDTNGFQLEKTVFMLDGKNVTIILYDVVNPYDRKVSIRVSPLLSFRHFHSLTNKDSIDWRFIQEPFGQGVTLRPSTREPVITMLTSSGQYVVDTGVWIENVYYRMEDARGESCIEDAFQPGWFEIPVDQNQRKRFHLLAVAGESAEKAAEILASIPQGIASINALYDQELKRLENLLEKSRGHSGDFESEDWLKWLVLAADSFLVDRRSTRRKSVIAGYHWFEDWGRDSLISLPGLTLVTNRFKVAREILLTFKEHCHKGIVPNRFPDQAGDEPVYNTVDATLWFFNAVLQYLKYTQDYEFVKKELWDTLESIIDYHVRGTLFDIRVDDDGLLEHGPQLTWMDARVNDQVITPREGKAVEIEALWNNALRTMELLATRFGQEEEAEKYSEMSSRAEESFVGKFWNPEEGALYDVVHGNEADPSLRPNQIIAVSLDFSILDKTKQRAVVETVWKTLWSTYGLRTLSKDDPRYRGKYSGDRLDRDSAYHNGTVWTWLLGPFTTAFLKAKSYDECWRRFAFENFLQPLLQREILQAGLGTISEIFDGDPPHMPRGCIAQAWSVAEPLRTFYEDILHRRPPYESETLGF